MMSSSSEVEFSELDSPEGKLWNELCSKEIYDEGYIKLGRVEGVFARSYLNFIDTIKNFEIRDDDTWVISFPKTGTTWTQEMVWCMMKDLDFEGAKEDLDKRFPYFEIRANWSPCLASMISSNFENATKEPFQDSFTVVANLPSPRFIKSHLHLSLLPRALREGSTGAKIIYVARNPKDTCISFYHHSCLLDGYGGSLEQFVGAFVTDNVFCSPFWTHLKEFWELRNRKDLLFLKYEDMKADLPSVIRQTADFLGKEISEPQVSSLEEHLSFENMKNNPAVNQVELIANLQKIHKRGHSTQFIRKGKVGSWKDELGPEMNAKLDEWIDRERIEGLY